MKINLKRLKAFDTMLQLQLSIVVFSEFFLLSQAVADFMENLFNT